MLPGHATVQTPHLLMIQAMLTTQFGQHIVHVKQSPVLDRVSQYCIMLQLGKLAGHYSCGRRHRSHSLSDRCQTQVILPLACLLRVPCPPLTVCHMTCSVWCVAHILHLPGALLICHPTLLSGNPVQHSCQHLLSSVHWLCIAVPSA